MENSSHISCNLYPISCNAENINVTSSASSILQWMSSVPVGITISITGLIGNILSIIVWSRIRRSLNHTSSTLIYFITMGVVDSFLLIFFLLEDATQAAFPDLMSNYWIALIYCFVIFPLFFFFKLASIWIIVAVTIDRYLLVVLTFRTSKLNTFLSIAIILVSGFVLNIPHFFNYIPQQTIGVEGSWGMVKTDYGKSKKCVNYEFWVHCMFIILVPWMVIACCNTAIIRKVWKIRNTLEINTYGTSLTTSSSKSRSLSITSSSYKSRKSQDIKTTITLVILTWTFIILLIWPCIAKCFFLQDYKKDDPETWSRVETSYAVSKLGIVINSSINCFFFCFTGTVFRKELLKLFQCA